MKVVVALFGNYARLLPPSSERGRAVVEVDDGTTVGSLLADLGVPDDGSRYISVDGKRAELSQPLWDGAEVRVIVPLGGG